MGVYINPGNRLFRMSANTDTYGDKSMLLAFTNSRIDTDRRFICVSKPRKFGKSADAAMMAAYYSCGCASRELFTGLKIAGDPSYKEHLNKYNAVFLNMQDFFMSGTTVSNAIKKLNTHLCIELKQEYPDVHFVDDNNFILMMCYVCQATGKPFVFVVDEWDCVIRDSGRSEDQKMIYLSMVRRLFTDSEFISLVYMTGVLPIKKYKESDCSLDMFDEISIVNPYPLEQFMGFTEEEVKALCERFGKSYDDIRMWFEGYSVNGHTAYNPMSVAVAMKKSCLEPVWAGSGAMYALADYIGSTAEGLQKAVINLLRGIPRHVDTAKFNSDLEKLTSADQVLAALVYLGYLTYDNGEVRIPNYEMYQCFVECIMFIIGES